MHTVSLSSLLNPGLYTLLGILYVFLFVLFLLLVLVACFTIYKRRIEFNEKLWQETIAALINEALFAEDGANLKITEQLFKLLRRSRFQNCLVDDLVKTTANISGECRQNLKRLYETLELDKVSVKKINNRKAHIKANGIQALAMMEQVKYVKKIFRLTNSPNEMVRNEAQCALVAFYGFLGLRFLNVTRYPVSQWQQIQLLNKLNRVGPTNFEPLKRWLGSPNESVVIFCLKLAAYYNCDEVYPQITGCLKSQVPEIKLYALEYLKKIPGEDGANQVVQQYPGSGKQYKLAAMEALAVIGTEEHILFVQQQLRNEDDDIKAAAATCLSQLHPTGSAFLQTHYLAGENPWKRIFLKIKTERAA